MLYGLRYATYLRVATSIIAVGACRDGSNGSTARASPVSALELSSLRVMPIPPLHASQGIFIAGDQIVSWGTSPERALWWSDSQPVRVLASEKLRGPIGAALARPHHVRILDTAARAELVFDESGRLTHSTPVEFPAGLESASYAHGRWFAATIDRDSGARIVALGNEASSTLLRHRVPIDSGGPIRERLLLATSGSDVLAISRFYPFAMYRLDSAGTVIQQIRPDLSSALKADSSVELQSLVTVGLVRLDRGYLLSFAELTSLRRMVAVLNEDGKTERVRQLNNALAFSASDPSAKTLLSVWRFSGSQELQIFRWAWAPSGKQPSNSPIQRGKK